jgi:integrase
MAKLFKRTGSPHFWLDYVDAGKRKQKSTGLRYDVSLDCRKAQEQCALATLQELKASEVREESRWELWVPELFRVRYSNKPATKVRYKTIWRSISIFIRKEGIMTPAQLQYDHLMKYLDWRQNPDVKGVYAASRNTTILEIKIWGVILQEAVRRKFILVNPAQHLGLTRDKPKEKPEITPEEEALIRLKLKEEPPWMNVAFTIAMATGCRLRETSIEFRNIDFKLKLLHLKTKGGREHTMPLPPTLEPLLLGLKAAGSPKTCVLPPMPSKAWWTFFRRIGLRYLSFHSTRVTVITRLARAGIQERVAMRYVGHASATVHRVYTRLKVEDLSSCVRALETP